MPEFEKIYSEYFDDVYKYVYSLCRNSLVAEEVTQDTFFKALKSIDSYKGECKLRVWLCQIAKNTYFTFYSKQQRLVTCNSIEQEQTCNFENGFINREESFEIHKALHNLEEPYKEVFSLRIFGELSFRKIGELFGKTEGWARVTYYRAKIKLKEDLL
ncbi:RNA polymerase sigma factor [Trichococcus collinsii]|uniref:RNA polymerase sigma-70 factor, ECF subfamily n=1 Tax=Trichococcus collinsii TaxID=157076 RepID=A0AB38A3B4_9LACT|nr:sigma-70 family RNA polymerase sigma factor [Trichococcus collinsii]CZR00044.1 rna polymerase sigma factor 70 region 4 type 2 [Trichococcus collinsii]SEA88724.1 RNA polymerase sigma-70 factor, ECF subfamily [Trichococcus collinsii]